MMNCMKFNHNRIFFRFISEASIRKHNSMNRTRLVANQLMKRKTEEKNNRKNLIINSADIQVIGSYSQGYIPSLLVNSEGHAYLFNCAEGTQRFCYTNKIKISNLQNVFATDLNWNRVAGAYGLSLTLQDVGLPKFTLHAAEGIQGFFGSTRTFMSFNTGIICSTRDHTSGEYIDQGIRVQPIALDESVQTNINEEENPLKKLKKISKLTAYFCSLPDLPGPLDPQKCRQLNVPVGPKLADLKFGHDITLDDGKVVKSADVCGPKSAGLNFLVIDCPSEAQIELIVKNSLLDRIRKFRSSRQEKQVNLVAHFSPENVTNHPKYRQWFGEFADECKHLFLLHDEPNRANFIDCYRLQYLMRKIDPAIFPALYLPKKLEEMLESELKESSDSLREYGMADPDEAEIKTCLQGNLDELDRIVKANSLDRFVVRPNKVLESVDTKMYIDTLYKNAKIDPHFEKLLQQYKDAQNKFSPAKEYEPEVVFLGTGSALPGKLRNTSCILVNFTTPYSSSIIMDCGEDSHGQLVRMYGPEGAKRVLRQLKMVYVSHHHADHHIGLVEIIRQRREVTDDPLILLLPPGVETVLDYHNRYYDDLTSTYKIYSTKTLKESPSNPGLMNNSTPIIKEDLYDGLNGLLDNIKIVGVEHCVHSCAVVMRFNIGHNFMNQFTIAYSGDARPSDDFILAGEGCDLLIHEATFDHKSQEAAVVKKHSTSTEAIHVSKRMKAKFTILTHFSARLPKIPYFTQDFDDKIGFAFDNMALRYPSDNMRLPLMKELLSCIFSKSLAEIDVKHLKVEARQKHIRNFHDEVAINQLGD